MALAARAATHSALRYIQCRGPQRFIAGAVAHDRPTVGRKARPAATSWASPCSAAPRPMPPPTGGSGSTLDPRSAARSPLAFTYLILCDGAYPCGASLAPSRGNGRGIGVGRGLSLRCRQSATVCAGGWPRLRPSQGQAFGPDLPSVKACSLQTRTKLEPNWIFVCVRNIRYLRTANHSNYLPMQADLPIFRSRSILAEHTAIRFMHRHGLDGDLTITQLTWLWTEGDAYPLILLSGSFNGKRFLADQRCPDFQWCVSLRSRNPSEVQSYGFLLRLLDLVLNDFTASILRQL